jgi:putative flippase GtrA/glycosyltransferase involved in cell wall biosynthesis
MTPPSQGWDGPADHHHDVLDVEIVVPVYNEQDQLASHVRRLARYVARHVPLKVGITIADNASTDGTWSIAQVLAAELSMVRAMHLPVKGRGRALRAAWQASDAKVLAYMDLDLSTDLAALLPLVAPLLTGHSDLAIGSRLSASSRVVRGPKREILSRGYNILIRTTLATRFSDAQCGFKAIRADRAALLLPLVQDNGWFFDTELLVLAERAGLRIHEVPVDWVDDPNSTVDIGKTVAGDLRGIARLVTNLAAGRIPITSISKQILNTAAPRSLAGQLWRFCTVGVISTLLYATIYLLTRDDLGALWANFIALGLSAVANTALNRWYSFGLSGSGNRLSQQLQALAVVALGWMLTSGALIMIDAHHREPRPFLELTVLVVANLLATTVRFLLMRSWVFRARQRDAARERVSR